MFFPASVQRCTGAFELRAIEVSGDWPARVPDDVGASVGDMLADLSPLPGGGEHGARDLEGAVGRAGPVRARRVEPGRDPRMVDGIEPHPAAYPVPPEPGDLRGPRPGEQQQPDRGGGEVVVGMVEHEAEALQLVQREEPLARGRPVAPHVAAGVRALGTKVPQLGLPHHDGEHWQGPVGVVRRPAHGVEPPPHIGAVDLRDAHIAKEGDEMAVDQMAVAFVRGRLPAPPLAAYELLHEIGEQRAAWRSAFVAAIAARAFSLASAAVISFVVPRIVLGTPTGHKALTMKVLVPSFAMVKLNRGRSVSMTVRPYRPDFSRERCGGRSAR